ncbi:ThiF family protein [Aquimarina sp. MAR_2010_214]|uniref:ThiF family adenylyltransferase n=1 Tax=Aquimarina sp. MAR_2010_214 TaxID=1250026 RepID=UPI000C703428|nr:ThiF family adenylyltransferase [Aquimarina sp. MAR_2010_214]PKV49968.1 ThiF family protein [Aquimarina sp. MAR_2010_214]
MEGNSILDNRKKTISEMHHNERYYKNALYVTPEQQDKIKNVKIVFGGVGLGSVLAEAALRLGFENFVFIDGDTVELSNLNRQNYQEEDITKSKVESITKRLLSINPNAKIEYHHLFLDPDNITDYIDGCDIAINAIDFDVEDTPFVFDEKCKEKGIPVIHPLNFGWAGAAYVVTPDSEQIYDVARNKKCFELVLIKNMLEYFKYRAEMNLTWFYEFYESYKENSAKITPPQLVVGSSLAAALVTNILFSLVNGLEVKTFPEPYFLSTR